MSDRGDSAGATKDQDNAGKTDLNVTMSASQANLKASRQNLAMGAAADAAAGGAAAQAPATNAIVYENTYRMKPEKKFQSEVVRRLTDDILKTSLVKVKYDAEKVPELTQKLANDIIAAVKKLEYDRYKIIVEVTIGEFKGQGIKVGSRALWDTTTDSYASASYKNATMFVVALVFGTYYE